MARREDGAQAVANARKLLGLALSEPELGPGEYAERIWEVQEVRHKEGDAPADAAEDVITIMTIHKAKGLEFPVVVIPDTMAGFRSGPRDVLVDPRLAMVTMKPGKIAPLAHRFVEEERALRRPHPRPAEALRLPLPAERTDLDEQRAIVAVARWGPAWRADSGRYGKADRGLRPIHDYPAFKRRRAASARLNP